MTMLKQLWTNTARFVRALEGMDDPIGHYLSSLEKRVRKLEHDFDRFEKERHRRP